MKNEGPDHRVDDKSLAQTSHVLRNSVVEQKHPDESGSMNGDGLCE